LLLIQKFFSLSEVVKVKGGINIPGLRLSERMNSIALLNCPFLFLIVKKIYGSATTSTQAVAGLLTRVVPVA
jgi:hypothetical protein